MFFWPDSNMANVFCLSLICVVFIVEVLVVGGRQFWRTLHLLHVMWLLQLPILPILSTREEWSFDGRRLAITINENIYLVVWYRHWAVFPFKELTASSMLT